MAVLPAMAIAMMFFFATDCLRAQSPASRSYHTGSVVLDDGNGHTTTIQASGTTGSFSPPVNGSALGDVITSDGSGGTAWQAPVGVPSGTVILFTGSTAPTGYTLLSGPTIIAGNSAWVSKTPSPTYRNAPMIGSVNGKIYVVGGYSATLSVLGTMDVYDPTLNAWSTDITTGTFTARGDGVAAVMNGKMYVLCGNKNPGYSADNERYDPVTKAWTTMAAAPGGRYSPLAGTSGNYIYLIGGGNGSNLLNNDVYDVVNDNWNVTRVASPLPSNSNNSSAAVVNGKFYLAGGNGSGSSATLRSYDPGTDTWATLTTTNFTDRGLLTAASINGKLYAIGGLVSGGPPFFFSNPVATTEIFDPSTNSWSAGISTGLTPQFGGRSAVVGGTIYMICGKSSGLLNEALLAGTPVYYYVKN